MDTEMRWKMLTNSPRNAMMPEDDSTLTGSVPLGTSVLLPASVMPTSLLPEAMVSASLPPVLCFRSACANDSLEMRRRYVEMSFQNRPASAWASKRAFGSAPSTTEKPSTIAMSSASPSCISRAASSSSVATDHDTENVRSPPSEERASAVPEAAMETFLDAATHLRGAKHAATVYYSPHLVEVVAREGVSLVRVAGGALCLRRLLLDACQPAVGSVHSTVARQSPNRLIRKKERVSDESTKTRNSAAGRRAGTVKATRRRVGVIVGATLRSVLQFAGVDVSRSCARQMRHLVRFFEPVVAAVCRVEGDREVLASGLACHRVLREQRRHMHETSEARGATGKSWLSRKGLKNVAMGVTASVLVAHHIASQEGADADTISSGLDECCERAERALCRWNLSDSGDSSASCYVMQAEARALGRARAAFAAAAAQARLHGLGRSDALRLQLETMRRAAWPAGERCDAETHVDLCERILSGRTIGNTAMPAPMLDTAAVPLSAISADSWLEDASDASDRDMYDGASSGSQPSVSSVSSVSSFASTCGSSDTDPASPALYSDDLIKFAFNIS